MCLILPVACLARTGLLQQHADDPSEKSEERDKVIDRCLRRVPCRLQTNITLDIRQSSLRVKVILALLDSETRGRAAVGLAVVHQSLTAGVVNGFTWFFVQLLLIIITILVMSVPEREAVRVVGLAVCVTGEETDQGVEIFVVNNLLVTEEVLDGDWEGLELCQACVKGQ